MQRLAEKRNLDTSEELLAKKGRPRAGPNDAYRANAVMGTEVKGARIYGVTGEGRRAFRVGIAEPQKVWHRREWQLGSWLLFQALK